MLCPLDVIWILDELIRPPGPKMIVCIEPSEGLYFRIDTDRKWQTPAFLKKDGVHDFLRHDSYLECGEPFEVDDYVIETSIGKGEIIGAISAALIPDILAAVDSSRTISPALKAKIKSALGR